VLVGRLGRAFRRLAAILRHAAIAIVLMSLLDHGGPRRAGADHDRCRRRRVEAGGRRQRSSLPRPPFGGTSAAIIGMIDFRLAGNLTLGGEGSFATAISGDQSQRAAPATNAFTSRHSDSVFSAVLKLGTPIDRRCMPPRRSAAVGVSPHGARRDHRIASFRRRRDRPTAHAVGLRLAYSFGGDVDVRLSPRIRILGVVRCIA